MEMANLSNLLLKLLNKVPGSSSYLVTYVLGRSQGQRDLSGQNEREDRCDASARPRHLP